MGTYVDTTWLEDRITKTKALIEAYEDAILALSSGAQTYSLNTGQTQQSVTKAQLGSLDLTLQRLENRLAVLEARREGGGVQGRPGF